MKIPPLGAKLGSLRAGGQTWGRW